MTACAGALLPHSLQHTKKKITNSFLKLSTGQTSILRPCLEILKPVTRSQGLWWLQADRGERVKEAITRVLQQDGHRWMKRLHNEGAMCLNCNWEELDLELSAQVS